ncbi:hypothetical protein COCMIDRAFT_23689 [Bipolaris oryzae ATCC 44560]|uniref:Zn(2)-C6 fungal-type domain-containing protein n=1 Tax=Bipolaris oryzae ATCC 44560 TaxID=930090 RepID=W6ZF53_COCMI|nr:uncharacterized protein COCMIDRAFT_23689 [Bipolaris oryzae ATCC 44560]EUC48518.1 hypothetical protein COCMIDRAFT_23689 [Bipolaris oryzae ATCC 44560]
MSATSPQYRSAAQTPSHFHDYPGAAHDALGGLATWQHDAAAVAAAAAATAAAAAHDSYPVGPSPAAFLHYPQPGVDSASLQAPSAWATGYVRPQAAHEWQQHQHQPDESCTDRSSVSYCHGDGSAPLPHHQLPAVSRHYQHHHHHQHQPDLTPTSTLPLAAHDHFHPLRISPETPATTADPPYSNHAQKPPPVPLPSHSLPQAILLHTSHEQQPPLHHAAAAAAAAWAHHGQYPDHTSDPIAASLPVTRHDSTASTAPWPMVESAEPQSASAVYDRSSNIAQEWPVAEAPAEHQLYAQHHAPVEHMDRTAAQMLARHRPPPKKKAAKVPSSFVERQEKLKVSKRKGPLQERQREKTHTMRKTKRICVRCRFYKSGCDEGDPCEKCEKITGHARSFREPCYREHLEDTSLIRRCNGREHQEEAEFLGYDWVYNSQLYEMEIIWNLPGYGPIPNAQPLRIAFRPYSPKRGPLDVATSVWSNREGQVPTVEQPAYAVYDTANLVVAVERYFSSLQPAIEEWIFARISRDEIAYSTYQEVIRMRQVTGSRALDLAMRLQCLSVVSQGYGSVFSPNIPGIREYDYSRLGHSDYEAYDRGSCDRPLPGAITHQMDVAAVKYLRKLEKLFVKELAALIFKPKIKPWYELFLTFYVIFWNLEYIHHGAQDYIKSKNGTLLENQVSNVVTTQIKKWEFAFPVLLYHWRCILRGYSPFKLARDNPDELRERGHIDAEGFQYVTSIANLFDRSNPDRFQPPLTGFATAHWSTSSEWIVKLFKEAGA